MITSERLHELFIYDRDTGIFTRRISVGRHDRHRSGTVVGSIDANGYMVTTVDGRRVYLHRMAILYVTGKLPSHDVDHIDHIRSNNAFSNLRCVPRKINCQNRIQSRKDRKYGTLLGVKKHRNRWQARINDLYIGSFKTEIEAHNAYVQKKRSIHEGCLL